MTRESALRTPGLRWVDDENNDGGNDDERNDYGRKSAGGDVVVSGRETRKMNLYQAVRDAMRFVPFFYQFLFLCSGEGSLVCVLENGRRLT